MPNRGNGFRGFISEKLSGACTCNSCSYVLGLDCKIAVVRFLKDLCLPTPCGKDTVTQLTNGFRHIRDEFASGSGITLPSTHLLSILQSNLIASLELAKGAIGIGRFGETWRRLIETQ